MSEYFKRHWFLTMLAALIAAGLTLGLRGWGPAVKPWAARLNPQATIAAILLLMAYTLDTQRIRAAFRAPGPVCCGFAVNFGFVPLAGWLLMGVQQSADFRLGLMIAAAVPSTTAAASVITRKARGNDAVSLLVTLSTNILCFVMTPLWLSLAASQRVEFDLGRMIVDLLKSALVPTVLGQLLRQPARLHHFADRHKLSISVVAQVLIELMVFTAALDAGTKLRDMQTGLPPTQTAAIDHANVGVASDAGPQVTLAAVGIAWTSCVGLHVAALAVGWLMARGLKFSRADSIPVAFSGSQKTLPTGLLVASMFAAEHPFAMFPMLLYHASQLFIDTLLAERWAGSSRDATSAPPFPK